MSDPDERLRAVNAAIAERAHLVRVRDMLAQDIATEERRVQQLAVELQYERADVERLTVGTMAFLERIFAGDDAVEKEKRELALAEARLREARGALDGLVQQARTVDVRIAQLVPAQLDADLAAARAAKEAALIAGHTPAGEQLADLAIRIESIDIELVPLVDAVAAGGAAFDALREILAVLDLVVHRSASLSDDRARALAGDAQAKLVGFHRALSEVATASFDVPLALAPGDTTFADAWIKALFGKRPRDERIASARAEMTARIERVGALLAPLRARHDELAARREALLAERQRLLG